MENNSDQSKGIEMKRYTISITSFSKIMVKLPEKFDDRPEACQKCPVKSKCVESCWQSVRITPWYIKPCGVRVDNVYFFTENSINNLKEKLKLGGKQ